MRFGRRMARAMAAAMLVGCAAPPPPPPPPAPPPPPPPIPIPAPTVWTRGAGVVLLGDSSALLLDHPFTRLDVLAADSTTLRVRCEPCEPPLEGSVGRDEVVHGPDLPEAVAGEDLAAFALAIREAALHRDLGALRPVMHPEFTFSFVGAQGRDAALSAWTAERFATLDRVPALLDLGLASPDGAVWAAPPAFSESIDYRGLRLGFRRDAAGRWEWLYLIQGTVPR